jgi:hypothetical protein
MMTVFEFCCCCIYLFMRYRVFLLKCCVIAAAILLFFSNYAHLIRVRQDGVQLNGVYESVLVFI